MKRPDMIGNKRAFRHGHARRELGRSPTLRSWDGMMARCFNTTRNNYERYGGRGITVCERWRAFDNFVADMGERPAGTTLDRYPDKNGNYEPGNCRWATPAEQAQNRRSNRLTPDLVNEIRGRIEHGESQASVAARLGLSAGMVCSVWGRKTWRDVP